MIRFGIVTGLLIVEVILALIYKVESQNGGGCFTLFSMLITTFFIGTALMI